MKKYTTNICFYNQSLSIEDIKLIAKKISESDSIKSVILEKVELDDEGIDYLSDALVENQSVNELLVFNNNVTDDGL